jgi:hypothetical protein
MAQQDRISKETLSAFVDGELPADEMSLVSKAIENDAQARDYVEAQVILRRTLRDAFAGVARAHVPAHLTQTTATAPISWQFRLGGWLERNRLAVQAAIPAGALAAGLLIGIAVQRGGSPDELVTVSARTGNVVARAELAFALEHMLAADAPHGAVKIGVSFRSSSGTYCRTFTVGSALDGMACHDGGDWRIALLNAAPSSGTPKAEYGQAASEMSGSVRNAVAASISGLPFDSSQERHARDRGWN